MKNLNMETAIKRYNELMEITGREYKTIGTKHSEGTEGWGLREMVAECEYVLSSYNEGGSCNSDMQYSDDLEERKLWKSHTGKLERFIKTYEPFAEELAKQEEVKPVNKLQTARQAAGLTQEQLADQTGISLSSIQKYERAAKDINSAKLLSLLKITVALKCQLKDILTDEEVLNMLEEPKLELLEGSFYEGETVKVSINGKVISRKVHYDAQAGSLYITCDNSRYFEYEF